MAKDTKEMILATALELFSQNGYAGTNIRELTASLGMVKSPIYTGKGEDDRLKQAYDFGNDL